MDKLFTRLLRYLPESIVSLGIGVLYFYNSFQYQYPIGYAGFFLLMVDGLRSNHYIPPLYLPYYATTNIPFAYPPFGIYFSAISIDLINISPYTYLRFAPPLFSCGFLLLEYFFLRQVFISRVKALIGVVLSTTAFYTYSYHVPSAGMTRALALLLVFASMIFVERTFNGDNGKRFHNMVIGSVFLGLTILTHLSYASFLLAGILVFSLLQVKNKLSNRIFLAGSFFLGGVVVSSPWWLMVLCRYGGTPFISAFSSHGNFDRAYSLLPINWESMLYFIKQALTLPNDWKPVILVGTCIGGLLYSVYRRRWVFIGWFLIAFFFIGESNRFLVMLGCFSAADAIGDLVKYIRQEQTEAGLFGNRIARFTSITLFATICFYNTFAYIHNIRPTLSDDVFDMTDWFRANTSNDAIYLFLANDNNLGEWMPYLTQRTTAVGNWGAEWTGDYERQVMLLYSLDNCAKQESYNCYHEIILNIDLPVTYLISFTDWESLNNDLIESNEWSDVFCNATFTVFERR